MQAALLYIGAGAIFLWGVAHLIPTRNVVSGFGALTLDNTRIITMEWLAEGLTLCFLGILVGIVAFAIGPEHVATHLVARACAAMLFVMAIVSSFPRLPELASSDEVLSSYQICCRNRIHRRNSNMMSPARL